MEPRIIVFSTLFPNSAQPNAGVFIRERMFRVGKKLPIIVIAPTPWFPFQNIIRKFKPYFRPPTPSHEEQQGIEVFHPRFFCVPGVFKFMDGFFMALGSVRLMRKLKKRFDFNVIDAHFAYPDGKAATLLSRWFDVPVTITLRGTEISHSKEWLRGGLLKQSLQDATRIFSVSTSLKKHAVGQGVDSNKIEVVGNGVDTEKFHPIDMQVAREKLGLAVNAKVIVTIGGLVERKGIHRVLNILPALLKTYPDLHYLVVGSGGAEGDWTERLKKQVGDLRLQNNVHFLGAKPPEELKIFLSAADLFVLSTRNEGWANVLLEAMACSIPVIASDVGGNSEVINQPALGTIVPFGDESALLAAVDDGLTKKWDKALIQNYAKENSWDSRVDVLVKAFGDIVNNCSQANKPRANG